MCPGITHVIGRHESALFGQLVFSFFFTSLRYTIMASLAIRLASRRVPRVAAKIAAKSSQTAAYSLLARSPVAARLPAVHKVRWAFI